MRRSMLAGAAGGLLLACTATAGTPPAPLALRGASLVRQNGQFTLRIRLDRRWKSGVLAPGTGTRLRVLYDVTGDKKADYTGRIVDRGAALEEDIAGHGSHFEPVPVERPTTTTARLTHPVDVLYPTVKQPGALRVTVQLLIGTHVDRLPIKGWYFLARP